MMEKIYLGDWLYNTGIVGFLNIINGWNKNDYWYIKDNQIISKHPDKLKFYDNYIEIDISIFNGYAEKYFDYAFNMYGRYSEFKDELNKILQEADTNASMEEIANYIDRLISRFSNKEFNIKTILNTKNINELVSSKEKLHKAVEKLKKSFKENYNNLRKKDIFSLLENIYGQKSFLNTNKKGQDMIQVFKNDFEYPILNLYTSIRKPQKYQYQCSICNRPAKQIQQKSKKGTKNIISVYDTGLAIFYGLSGDVLNYHWNTDDGITLCHLCEMIYFSSFAGFVFTKNKKQDARVLYFVNNNTSIKDLIQANLYFKNVVMNSNIDENIFASFFTQLVSNYHKYNAKLRLQNIAVIEVYSKQNAPRIYALNISERQAKYLSSNELNNMLRRISRKYYKIKDEKVFISIELINLYLQNKLGYWYLYKLTKLYLMNKNGSKIETNIRLLTLQVVNKILTGGLNMSVSNKEMAFFFEQGKKIAERMRKNNQDRKISSIVYRLLNNIKIGDKYQFLDIVIRLYMAYLGKTDVDFKRFNDDESFYPLAYSFINGLLFEKNDKNEANIENSEESNA